MSVDDYAFGNARVRVLRRDLLGQAEVERLVEHGLDELLVALAHTAYRAEVEAAIERHQGISRLHAALRERLARVLGHMRRCYDGTAGAEVELLLRRWDLRNVLTILRGQAGGHPPAEILASTVAIGRLDAGVIRELTRPIGLRGAVDLLAAWQLPTPSIAAALRGAWPAYARSDDLAALEHAVLEASAADTVGRLQHAREEAEPLAEYLRREIDQQNVVTALRLRADALGDGPPGPGPAGPFLATAAISSQALAAIAAATTRGEVAALLAATSRGREWARPLTSWVEHGHLSVLAGDLSADLARSAMRLIWRGDPLGSAVPVSFAFAFETEVRNLRIIGEGAWAARPRDEVRARLIFDTQLRANPAGAAPWLA